MKNKKILLILALMTAVIQNSNATTTYSGGSYTDSNVGVTNSSSPNPFISIANGDLTYTGVGTVNSGFSPGAQLYGIEVLSGGIATNNGTITVSGFMGGNQAIRAEVVNAQIINGANGKITVNGGASSGVRIRNGHVGDSVINNKFTNDGLINVSASGAQGVYAKVGADAINNNKINITSSNSFGMYVMR